MQKIVTPLVVASLLSGCASGSLRYAGAAKEATGTAEREASQILWDCPSSERITGRSALLAAGVGIAVDTALSALSAALERAKKARTAVWTANKSVKFDDCRKGRLTITRGVFDGQSGATGNSSGSYPTFNLIADVIIQRSEIEDPPASAIVSVVPLTLDYADTAALDRGKKRKEITVSVDFAAIGNAPKVGPEGSVRASEKPDAVADESGEKNAEPAAKPVSGAIVLNLGKLEIGRKYTFHHIEGAASIPLTPMHNLAVVVTESEDASVALTALAAAFEKNKDGVGAAIKDAISDAVGKK